jgi:hypothetical protein
MRRFESFLPSQTFHGQAPAATVSTDRACPLHLRDYRHGLRQPDGVYRQRQSQVGGGCGQAPEHFARAGECRPFLRRRGQLRDPRACARPRCIRAAVDLRADQRQPDGTDGHGGCAEARLRRTHHGRHPLFRLRPPGSPHALGARRDHRQGGRQHAADRRRAACADGRPACRPDPGLFRHPGGQRVRRAHPAWRHLEAAPRRPAGGVARRRRRGARPGAGQASRIRPGDHRQAAAEGQRVGSDEHHRRSRRPHLRHHGRHGRYRRHAVQGGAGPEGTWRKARAGLLYPSGAVGQRRAAHHGVGTGRTGGHRHHPLVRRSGAPANASARYRSPS